MDWSLPGSSVRGNCQAEILEWLSFPSPRDLPNPGIKPTSPALGSRFFTTELLRKTNPIRNSRVFHFHPSQKYLQNAHLLEAPVGRECITEPGPYGTRGSWTDGWWFQRACVTWVVAITSSCGLLFSLFRPCTHWWPVCSASARSSYSWTGGTFSSTTAYPTLKWVFVSSKNSLRKTYYASEAGVSS